MATATLPVGSEEYECTICHDYFKDPKILPCGHLLCRPCLLSWLQSQEQALCPLCRCPIKEKKPGQSLERIAEGLLTDSAMASLVEAHRLLSRQHVCCACVHVAAVCLCVECGDLFCQPCSTLHQKQSLSKGHTLETLTALTAEKLAASRRSACAVHSDKLPEVFCPAHGVSVCLRCATTTHRHCPDLTDLEEKVQEARTVLAELAASLAEGEKALERSIKQLEEQLKHIDQRTQSAVADLRATYDRLEAAVKRHRQRAEERVLQTGSEKKRSLMEAKNLLLRRRGKLTSHKGIVVRSQGVVTRPEVTDATPEMKTLVNGLDRSTSLPPEFKVKLEMDLAIDPEEVSRIEKALSVLDSSGDAGASASASGIASVKTMYRSSISRHIKVWHDVGVLSYDGATPPTPVAQFIAAKPLSYECDNFAFEIVNEGRDRCISIGLCPSNYQANRQPGWNAPSVGYHADDGGIYCGSGFTNVKCVQCRKGDIMVCKLDFTALLVTFYKNYAQVTRIPVRIPPDGLYPCVGMHSPAEAVRLLQKEPWQ